MSRFCIKYDTNILTKETIVDYILNIVKYIPTKEAQVDSTLDLVIDIQLRRLKS